MSSRRTRSASNQLRAAVAALAVCAGASAQVVPPDTAPPTMFAAPLPTLVPPVGSPPSNDVRIDVAAGNLSGGAFPDVVVAATSVVVANRGIRFVANTTPSGAPATPSFLAPVVVPANPTLIGTFEPFDCEIGDFDGDGLNDVVAAMASPAIGLPPLSTPRIEFFRGTGGVPLPGVSTYPPPSGIVAFAPPGARSTKTIRTVSLGATNGLAICFAGAVGVYSWNAPTASFLPVSPASTFAFPNYSPIAVDVADMDGDGVSDLAVALNPTPNAPMGTPAAVGVALLGTNGAPQAGFPVVYQITGAGPAMSSVRSLAIGGLQNGSSGRDILVLGASGLAVRTATFFDAGLGAYALTTVTSTVPAGAVDLEVADLDGIGINADGNGFADAVVAAGTSGNVGVGRNRGPATAGPWNGLDSISAAAASIALVSGAAGAVEVDVSQDFDGDGIADLLGIASGFAGNAVALRLGTTPYQAWSASFGGSCTGAALTAPPFQFGTTSLPVNYLGYSGVRTPYLLARFNFFAAPTPGACGPWWTVTSADVVPAGFVPIAGGIQWQLLNGGQSLTTNPALLGLQTMFQVAEVDFATGSVFFSDASVTTFGF